MNEKESDKPPPTKDTICQPVTTRVHSGSRNGSVVGRREVAFIRHISSPMLASRLSNDLYVLANIRLFCKG